MFWIALMGAGAALANPPEVAATTVETREGPRPGGVSVEWAWEWDKGGEDWGSGWNVEVRVDNSSNGVIEVDWDRSVFVDADGRSGGIVPGSTRRGDVGLELPPSVVPPGSWFQEAVIRRDDVSLDLVEALVFEAVDGAEVGATLAIEIGGTTAWISDRFRFEVDEELLNELRRAEQEAKQLAAEQAAAARAEQEAARAAREEQLAAEQAILNAAAAAERELYYLREAELAVLEGRESTVRGLTIAPGVALLVVGTMAGLSNLVNEGGGDETFRNVSLGSFGGALVIGLPIYLLGDRRADRIAAEREALEAAPLEE
jgi:hypothetical protein